ncbi:MAG: N-acetyltransferase [Chloroflexota bacterium]
MIIRHEKPNDFEAIFEVEKAAFQREDEAIIVEKLRQDNAIVCSLVAIIDNAIVGHAVFSKGILKSQMHEETVVALGPIAVHPSYQNMGIGKSLINKGNQYCREQGFAFVAVLGHTTYYPKFGFQPSYNFNISCEFEVPDDAFMILELKKGALLMSQGTFFYHQAFR